MICLSKGSTGREALASRSRVYGQSTNQTLYSNKKVGRKSRGSGLRGPVLKPSASGSLSGFLPTFPRAFPSQAASLTEAVPHLTTPLSSLREGGMDSFASDI